MNPDNQGCAVVAIPLLLLAVVLVALLLLALNANQARQLPDKHRDLVVCSHADEWAVLHQSGGE